MRRVVVTGLGLVTPLADGVEESWSRILDGQSGAGPITQFDPSRVVTQYACEVPRGDGSDGTFNADDCLRMGLVNRVVPNDELDGAVDELAERIAENAPLTQMAFKAAMTECQKACGEPDVERVRQLADTCFASSDYKEGRRAFMEKRKPAFKGQ